MFIGRASQLSSTTAKVLRQPPYFWLPVSEVLVYNQLVQLLWGAMARQHSMMENTWESKATHSDKKAKKKEEGSRVALSPSRAHPQSVEDLSFTRLYFLVSILQQHQVRVKPLN